MCKNELLKRIESLEDRVSNLEKGSVKYEDSNPYDLQKSGGFSKKKKRKLFS